MTNFMKLVPRWLFEAGLWPWDEKDKFLLSKILDILLSMIMNNKR